MNRIITYMMCIYILTATGCKKDSLIVTTGIIGTIKYGQGDCMPSPDPISRVISVH